MNMIMVVVGALLLINGIHLCIISNLTSGTALTFAAGAFFLAWGIFYRKINEITKTGVLKYIKISIICLLCAEVILLTFIAVYGQRDTVTYDEEALIVLGAGLKGDRVTNTLRNRLDKAVAYHEKNPRALIVVSGGQGFQETVTEASAMKKYLVERGVSADLIIEEGKSTSTAENMAFSKKILDSCLDGDYKIAFTTNDFHIYRSFKIAGCAGFSNVTHIHSDLQWYNIAQCYLRESLAVLKLWILG